MTHTKGPWKLEKAHDDYILLHKNIWFMNLVGRWYPAEEQRLEHEANACLIAAAPDLLEALESLLRCSEYKATDYCGTCVPAAKQAIQKARGQ